MDIHITYNVRDTREISMKIKDLENDYRDNLIVAGRIRDEVVVQIQELLISNDITLGVPIESRVKSWSSIKEKLQRKNLEISKIQDLQDLVGVRLILLFKKDINRIISLVSANFDVLLSEDTAARLGESEFGYQSQHFVIRLPKKWLAVPSLSTLGDFYIELQVRTLSQHIWAAASHKLQYKNVQGIPQPLRRSISRVSALLEIIDFEFDRVLEERKKYIETFLINDSPLDVDRLESYLTERWPIEYKKKVEPYAQLLADLNAFGIDSTKELSEIINRHYHAVMEVVSNRIAKYNTNTPESNDFDEPSMEVPPVKYKYSSHVGLTRIALKREFGEEKVKNVIEVHRPPKRPKKTLTR